MAFKAFPKISRLARPVIITEKIDGTNAQIHILHRAEEPVDEKYVLHEDGDHVLLAGSRTRYITPSEDNHGFAKWVLANREALMALGPGCHYGEWWGLGIQRGYGLKEKRFSLFNTHRWGDDATRPACCHVVPIIGRLDVFDTESIGMALETLKTGGSVASPGFMKPEGIVIFHVPSGNIYKRTIVDDHKGEG